MRTQPSATVATSLGDMTIDSSGSPVSVVHADPNQSYVGVPQLLQRYINESSVEAWNQIKVKIDRTYEEVDRALGDLEKATGFAAQVRDEVAKGKKILFKPNLVNPASIHPVTHGPDEGDRACTDWTFVAAVMRWFHDKLGITYHQMCVGEGGSSSVNAPSFYNLHFGQGRTITPEAVMEGKSGEFYGGWGFYFARKYLAESHDPSHADDPMQGHEESVLGTYIPPGLATDKLMVYDTNRTYDDESKERDVEVPHGAHFKTITLHKAFTGGNPADPDDLRDYPGCVLVNLPKLKVHNVTLLTCAVKNLGIGLYPMQAAERNGPQGKRWKYGTPNVEIPIRKGQVPHGVWQLATDLATQQPIMDENGNPVFRRTAGIAGTMADVIKAVEACGTTFIHVVDGIECINIDHTGLEELGVKVAEGLVIAGLDPVAVDLVSARYLFKTVPMAEARRVKEERSLPGDFLQRVPAPKFNGQNIVTEDGYDGPIYRDTVAAYAEARGLGRREYHVVGWDLAANAPLVSVEGHLGRVEDGKFAEVITGTIYMDAQKFLWDMQATTLRYLAAIDEMAGTSYKKAVLELYDYNGDGIIDFDEKGRMIGRVALLVQPDQFRGTERYGFLHGLFGNSVGGVKFRQASWNATGVEVPKSARLSWLSYVAMRLSQSSVARPDPSVPGMTYGNGNWPSLELVERVSMIETLYGPEYPARVGASSLYGLAVAHADKALNGGTYTGSKGVTSDPQAAEKYVADVAAGAEPLDFILYVPRGWSNVGRQLPNVEETDDPAKILTATFGHEGMVW